jgi:hypothetical protein
MAEEAVMSEVATGNGRALAVRKAKPPAPGQETEALMERATKGDESCRPEVQALLADGEYGAALLERNGSPLWWIRRTLIAGAAGKNILLQEAITQNIDRMSAELAGPNPTPIERLLAERISICWFIVNRYEDVYANSKGWSLDQASFQHRKIDRAHARFLSAAKTLAQIRKLALPTLQLNIARNQVNMAEAGS